MHTLIASAVGLLVLVLLLVLGRSSGWSRQAVAVAFLGVWLLATVIHGAVGISHGQSLMTELAVGLVIYGVPVMALVWALRRLSWPVATRSAKM